MLGSVNPINAVDARREVQHAHASHDRVRRVFGARDAVSLDEGLARMAAWVRRHGVQATPAFPAVEVARNMPTSWLAT